ncbi:hypothetical protein BC941DRAFT_415958 [Chlamydoabsidia padenii]|nr:hypothetical protein BC941DRAFT_415958 [Chlamydoabsidia padenii]
MLAGNTVLLSRILAVVAFHWKVRIKLLHLTLLLARFIVAVIDIAHVYITFDPIDGGCDYQDSLHIGITYTSLDTCVDFYATCSICFVLIRHMRKLNQDGLVTANFHRYIAIAIYNGTRTLILTIVNLLTVVGIAFKQGDSYFIPLVSLLWPITNLLFVSFVGYDTDFTEVIRNMRTQFEDKPISMDDIVLPTSYGHLSHRNSSTPII